MGSVNFYPWFVHSNESWLLVTSFGFSRFVTSFFVTSYHKTICSHLCFNAHQVSLCFKTLFSSWCTSICSRWCLQLDDRVFICWVGRIWSIYVQRDKSLLVRKYLPSGKCTLVVYIFTQVGSKINSQQQTTSTLLHLYNSDVFVDDYFTIFLVESGE